MTETDDITISLATADDGPDLVALLGAQLAEHGIDLAQDRLTRAIAGALESPMTRGAFLVARLNGRPVAVAYLSFVWSVEHGGRSAWLDELYVTPAHRDRGIGRRLLHAAVDLAREQGCAAIDLEVETDHTRAARLYAREGFRAHTRARWVRKLS